MNIARAREPGCPATAAPVAAAIAVAESGGNPGAQGDITLQDGTWDWSEGLWQIRGLKSERSAGTLPDSMTNADPVRNALAMVTISSGCTDWTPWSTFTNGAFLSYLGLSKDAVLAAGRYRLQTGSYPTVAPGQPAGVPTATRPLSRSARRASHARPGGAVAKPRRGAKPTSPHSTAPTSKPTGPPSDAQPPVGRPAPTTTAPKPPLPSVSAPAPPLPTRSVPKPPLPTRSLRTLLLPTSSLPLPPALP